MEFTYEGFKAGTPSNKVDDVVEIILDKIRKHILVAGDRIPTETELCELTNVSRTSVREALKRLEALTIVRIKRGDGTYISQPEQISYASPMAFKMLLSNITWEEVLQFREMLDFIVLRCAIENATQEDIAEIKYRNDIIGAICREGGSNYTAAYKADLDFHRALAEATKNRIISDLYSASFEIFGEVIHRNYQAGQAIELTCFYHNNMIESVERRDVMLAAYAAYAAISNWASWVRKQNNPLYYFMPTDQDNIS